MVNSIKAWAFKCGKDSLGRPKGIWNRGRNVPGTMYEISEIRPCLKDESVFIAD